MWVYAARSVCAIVLSSLAVACGTETGPPADAESTRTSAAEPSPGPARIPYAVGDRVVLPDGTQFTLPLSLDFGGRITPFRGGFLVASVGEGYFLTRVGEDGQAAPGNCSGGLAVSEDRTLTAWSVTACLHDVGESVIHRAATDVTRADEVAQDVAQYRPHLVGMIGDEVIYNETPSGVWITDLVNPPRRIPGLSSASSVAPGRGWVAGQVADRPDLTAVLDLESGVSLWQAPGVTLAGFSPDEEHVFGYRGHHTTIFESATGRRVADVGGFDGIRLDDLVWEDASHLLGSARTDSGLVIVRVGLDGAVSQPEVVRDLPGLGVAFAVQP
jgi:hypothetical protein